MNIENNNHNANRKPHHDNQRPQSNCQVPEELRISKNKSVPNHFSSFLSKNRDLPPFDKYGIHARPFDFFPDRLTLAILIEPETTLRTIKNAWWWIQKWRERIDEYNLSAGMDFKLNFLEYLCSLKEDWGMSYQQIAEYINNGIANYIRAYLGLTPIYRKDGDIYFDDLECNPQLRMASSGRLKIIVERILETLKLDSLLIDDLLGDGIRRVKEGQEPFITTKNIPVDRQRVINRIREFQTQKQNVCRK